MKSGDFGQPRLEELLDDMLERGRVNGSFVFEGPVGVGKEALALELGRLANCENGGRCPAKPPFGPVLGGASAAGGAGSAKTGTTKAGQGAQAAKSKPAAGKAGAKKAAVSSAAEDRTLAPGRGAGQAPRCNSCHKFDLLVHPDLLLVFPVPKDTWDEKLPETRGQSSEPARNTIGRILHAKAANPYYREDFDEHVNIEAEVLRDKVIPAVYSRPVEGRVKTVIISDCDLMAPKIANLLLKTLEEPPANCLLVLTTAVPQLLLPTILSRCQRLHFAPLEPAWMQPRLQAFYEETPSKTRLAATLSQGSMHIAQRYLTGDLDEVRERVFAALAAAARGEALDLLDLAAGLAQERKKKRYIVPLFLRLLAAAARDALLVREGLVDATAGAAAAGAAALVNADRLADVARLAKALDAARLRGILHGTEVAEREIAGNALAEHSLGRLFLGMTAAPAPTPGAAAPASTRREGRR